MAGSPHLQLYTLPKLQPPTACSSRYAAGNTATSLADPQHTRLFTFAHSLDTHV